MALQLFIKTRKKAFFFNCGVFQKFNRICPSVVESLEECGIKFLHEGFHCGNKYRVIAWKKSVKIFDVVPCLDRRLEQIKQNIEKIIAVMKVSPENVAIFSTATVCTSVVVEILKCAKINVSELQTLQLFDQQCRFVSWNKIK